MKFTNGYWLIKDEITPLYAVEYSSHKYEKGELTVYTSSKHVSDRNDMIDVGMLTIKFSSPMENIIKVNITHFAGVKEVRPYIEVNNKKVKTRIKETDDCLEYISGNSKARIDKRPNKWCVEFYRDDVLLSRTSYRNMAYMKNNLSHKNYVVEQLSLDVGEYVYGFGEKYTPFIKNGQVVDCWNEDGGTASEITYKNIPFYLTNKGYGVLVDDEGDVSFEVASEKVEFVQFSVEAEALSYYFICANNPKDTIKLYTDLTGKPALPPAWSFGLWLSTSFTTNYDEKTTNSFINGMKERNIPLHVFHFDCYWMDAYEWCNFEWDKKTFPDPEGMLKRYHDLGLKVCVWINPYIGQKSKLFEEGKKNGYFLTLKNGNIWQSDRWQPGMAVVDFTNPKAKKWYLLKLKALLDMGVDCFKTDFGERIPVKDIVYYDGSDSLKMHNYYTYLFNEAVFSLLEKEKGKNEAIVFARSATVGSQKFPCHWGGDCSASYVSMAETLRGGLSLATCGFGFWSHDIGGFEETAPSDVYKRWCAFGLLSSHSRLHGSKSYRVPWNFGEEASDVLRTFVNLKCRLMPYLYSKAVESHETGVPILRSMLLEFVDDNNCHVLDHQYMLGDKLLVAPIFRSDNIADYYLPKGKWIHLQNGKEYIGEKWYKEEYDFNSLPLFVRKNSILLMGDNDNDVDYDYSKHLRVCISYFEDGACDKVDVVNNKGKVVGHISVTRKGDTLYIDSNSNLEFEIVQLASEKLAVA